MNVYACPEELQKVEHRIRLCEARLDNVLTEKSRIEQEEGKIRCDIQRLENEKYRLITGREGLRK